MPLRYLFIIIILFFLNNTVFAAETVNNFDDFNKALTEEGTNAEVSIESDLKASCDLGCQGKDDLKIYGNNHTLDGANQQGIIVEQNKNLTVENLEIENFKSSSGGALMSEESSSVDIKDVTFKNNEATEGDGGAFCNHCQVKDLTGEFSENSAYHNGGAICNQQEGNIENLEGTFENNTAKEGFGGAVFNFGSIGNIKADFLNNSVEEYYGGAIANMKVIGSIQGNF